VTRMRSFARAVATLTAFALIGGPPVLIGYWLLHRPPTVPTTDGVRDWLQQPRTTNDILAGAATVAALLWLIGLGYLIRRGLRGLSRRWLRLRHLPLPTPAQMTASSMAGIAVLTLPTTTAEPNPEPRATDGAPPPSDPSQPDHQQQAPATRTEPGIDLPGGGWVPYRTAVAVAALATTIRLLRRRSYRPDGRQLGTHHNDADLQPLPTTAQAVIAASAHVAPLHPVRPLHLPPGALRLSGPGAEAAARGLIVTVALTGTTTPPTTVLAISQRQWKDILPGLDHSTIPAAGLVITPNDEATRPTNDAGHAEPYSAGLSRSSADARQAASMTILTLSDTAPAEIHWHVAADGTITATKPTIPQRLCVLDPQAASDLLALIHQQHQAASDIPAPSQVTVVTPKPHNGRTPPARLTLLGGCTLTVAGQPMRLRRSASMQILAYLVP
jgi:hypothetical protein